MLMERRTLSVAASGVEEAGAFLEELRRDERAEGAGAKDSARGGGGGGGGEVEDVVSVIVRALLLILLID